MITVFYFNIQYFKMLIIPVMAKLNFWQSSVSHDPSDIIGT